MPGDPRGYVGTTSIEEQELEPGHPGVDAWGITNGHWGTDGQWHETPPETRAALRRAMGTPGDEPPPDRPVWVVPSGWGEPLQSPCRLVLESGADNGVVDGLEPDLPTGRHRLEPIDGGPHTLLIVRPRRCHRPSGLRASALAVQLYAARSRTSWGIGDLRDLRTLGTWASAHGIDLVATSPLHAPSPGDRPQPSPYYPSSRRFLSPLHVCVDDVEGAGRDDEVARLAGRARALVDDRRIDREAVWAAKLPALERLFEIRGTTIDRHVEDFRAAGGDDLQRFATFCAIAETHPGPWQSWPSELRHPDSPAVRRFAVDDGERVRFHAWLQWVADRQLHRAAEACPLVTDLAVGVDPGGADAWSDQDLLALDARIGAPPDDFAPAGQDWGLPPPVPHAMRADGYESFARTLRANMRTGGGLRMDHVLGLFRTFWIPPGGHPGDGAYVRSHADELLAVLAIESQRTGTVVVGEDLGTVEEGVREMLAATGILGTRLVYFEDGTPDTWPSDVLGAATTHDLPTIAGMWTGADRRAREDAGLGDDGTGRLRSSLERIAGPESDAAGAVCAVHRALAASPVELAVGNLDDVLVVEERPNMPGTTDGWPNWSIALPRTLDELVDGPVPETLQALSGRHPERPG
jgi:4-alpha-glucanotransferase